MIQKKYQFLNQHRITGNLKITHTKELLPHVSKDLSSLPRETHREKNMFISNMLWEGGKKHVGGDSWQ